MTRLSHLILAAFFAAIVGIAGLAPVRAAPLPTGSAITLDQTSKPQADSVRYHYRRRYYRPRYVYRPARVYYRPAYYGRRCVMRPRVVWTPYGYTRRWVRVCRW